MKLPVVRAIIDLKEMDQGELGKLDQSKNSVNVVRQA